MPPLRFLAVRRLALSLTVLSCAAGAGVAWADEPTNADPRTLAARLSEKYPGGSIQDEDTADRAKVDATAARQAIAWSGYDREVACQQRFFVTPCTEDVHREQRRATWVARDVELEANSFIRRKRDEEYLDRKAKEMADAEAQTQRMAEQHVKEQADYQRSQTPLAGAVKPRGPASAGSASQPITPEQRQANQAAYEQKQRDAAQRQADIEARQAKRAATPPAKSPTEP